MDIARLAPEVVTRPEPGLARGVWETSPLAFYIAAGAVVTLAALYLAFRLRILRRRGEPPPPPSSRRR